MSLLQWVPLVTVLPVGFAVSDRLRASWHRSNFESWLSAHAERLHYADRLEAIGEAECARQERLRADRKLAMRMVADEYLTGLLRRRRWLVWLLLLGHLVVLVSWIVGVVLSVLGAAVAGMVVQVVTACLLLVVAGGWRYYTGPPGRSLRPMAQRIVRYRRARLDTPALEARGAVGCA